MRRGVRRRAARDHLRLGPVQSNAAARKLAALAELVRRRPAPGCVPAGPAELPESWSEFTGREAGAVLGICDADAEGLLGLAQLLETCLPGTRALFRAGVLSQDKAEIIARYTMLLDPAEARAAEAKVLDQAGSLTPGELRAAIRRAVMQVNPGAARKRREHQARRTRVERWAEDSGNAGLAGREMPPAEVPAADQRVTAWAKELRKAGLEGSMDQLRARAYLDILLGVDSRPPGGRPDGAPGQDAGGEPPEPPPPAPGGPLAGVIPPGFAGHVNMTVPAMTLTRLADRPGEMGGIGPIDPDLEANTMIVTRTGHQPIQVSNTSTRRTVAPAGSVTGVRHATGTLPACSCPGVCDLLQRPPCCRR